MSSRLTAVWNPRGRRICPVAHKVADSVICLPMYSGLSGGRGGKSVGLYSKMMGGVKQKKLLLLGGLRYLLPVIEAAHKLGYM